jgi:hypothetical protein
MTRDRVADARRDKYKRQAARHIADLEREIIEHSLREARRLRGRRELVHEPQRSLVEIALDLEVAYAKRDAT